MRFAIPSGSTPSYLTWGGMPVAALTDDPDERSDYLKGLFDEVYLKDIRERHGIKDDLVLANLIDILSSDIGSLTNPHKVGDTMDSLWKIRPSDHTLKSYIEHLEDAFLFGHARRFEVKGRRYLDSPVKYYATDLGLRNARLNFRDTDPSHPMENVLYNELLRRGCNVDVGVVPISARDAKGRQSIRQHEIDFVVNRGRDKIYVQSALRMDDAEKERREISPSAQDRGLLQEDRHHGGPRRTAGRCRRNHPRRRDSLHAGRDHPEAAVAERQPNPPLRTLPVPRHPRPQ